MVEKELQRELSIYMFACRCEEGEQNHIKIRNKSFNENLTESKYLGPIVTYQNYIHQEIKNMSDSGNYSVQNIFSTRLLSRNLIPLCMRVTETWSLTLRDGHRVTIFENRVLRGIYGTER